MNIHVSEIDKCESFLRDGHTIIMIAHVTFLTARGERHRRKHLNLKSPVADQINTFKRKMEELNDYAGVHLRLLIYPGKEDEKLLRNSTHQYDIIRRN